MKITEADVQIFRRPNWSAVLPYPGTPGHDPAHELPSYFFSESEALYAAELAGEDLDVVAFLAFRFGVPTLCDDYDWYAISHQAGGYACDHPGFVGTPLSLRPPMRERLVGLARGFFEYANGHFYRGDVLFSHLTDYAGRLADMGLHCEQSYEELMEAYYPIDATQAHLDLLSENPPLLDVAKKPGEPGRMMIVVLAENSD